MSAVEPAARAVWLDRVLALFAIVRAGEGVGALVLSAHAFLLMTSYYVLKTAREPLLLAGGSAELKSYAQAAVAAALVVIVPVIVWLLQSVDRRRLLCGITLCAAAAAALFYAFGAAGFDIGFAYYVWVGVLGVTLLAQFWSHASHVLGAERGRRLFPLIMAGAAVGGLLGPVLCNALFAVFGAWKLLALGGALLAATAPLTALAAGDDLPRAAPDTPVAAEPFVGIATVLRNRYLMLLAASVMLLNCVSTTGDYLLTRSLLEQIERDVAAAPGLDRASLVAEFYGQYYFVVNFLTVLVQLLLVSRALRFVGVRAAILVAPAVAVVGYGLVAVVPLLAVLRVVKTIENSLNYSVTSTARQILYLPLAAAEQSAGRTAIETLFVRLGDVLQAVVVAIGVGALALSLEQLALLNLALAASWAAAAAKLGRLHPPETLERLRVNRPAFAAGACCALCIVAFAVAPAGARAASLFDSHEPLSLTVELDDDRLCADCEPVRARISYVDEEGNAPVLGAALRVRGKWRAERDHCRMPPLFVSFDAATATMTPFEGQPFLPLTSPCGDGAAHEQYVLKEYLAYRIHNRVADVSLRVRLARVTYRLGGTRPREVTRYAFFTENFTTLAARSDAAVATGEPDLNEFDARELANLELFEYLIGNTDWSVVARHNVVVLSTARGLTAVPYDFDFAGVVDAAYAVPPPQLRIASVRQRVFRGYCRPGFDWLDLLAEFEQHRAAVETLVNEVPALSSSSKKNVRRYLAQFFAATSSAKLPPRAGLRRARRPLPRPPSSPRASVDVTRPRSSGLGRR